MFPHAGTHTRSLIMDNPDQLATLTPGAGQGIGKLIFDRILQERPEFISLMVDTAIDGLKAMSPRRWDKDTQQWLQDPDYRVRMQTWFGLLAQAEGEPIKRIVHEIRKSGIDPLEALDSPAAVQAAERMVAGARAKLRRKGVGMKPAEVVDVEG